MDSLLDQQDQGEPFSADERQEAEGLVNLADLLSVLRLRAERAAAPKSPRNPAAPGGHLLTVSCGGRATVMRSSSSRLGWCWGWRVRAWLLAAAGLLLGGLAALGLADRADPARRPRRRRRRGTCGGPAALPRGRLAARATPGAADTPGDPASAERGRGSPDFALAYATLADAYNLCGDYGWAKADEVFPKAKEAAEQALARNPKLAEAHLALVRAGQL